MRDHNHKCDDCICHSYAGHNYTGHDYTDHNYTGRNCACHNYICHNCMTSAPHAPVPTKLHSSYPLPCAPSTDGALDPLLLRSYKYITSSLDAPCAADVPTATGSPRTLHPADALGPAASPSKSDTMSELSTFLHPNQSKSPDEATQPSGVPSLSIYQDIAHVNPDLPLNPTSWSPNSDGVQLTEGLSEVPLP